MKLKSTVICKFMVLMVTCLGFNRSKAQDYVVVDSVVHSNRVGLENLLQGQISGLLVRPWTGTPGMQSTINLRGISLDPTDASTLPLVLVNGVPLLAGPSAVTGINPLTYFSPDQILRIEVIKDIAQLAQYGVLAANGAINIIIKEGSLGPLNVRVSANSGADFITDYKDDFYRFDPSARKNAYTSGTWINEQSAVIDGGGEYGSYMFGLNNYKSSGTIKDADFNRQALFLNAKYNISEALSMHFYNNFAMANKNGRYSGEYSRDLTSDILKDESFFMDDKKNLAVQSSLQLQYRFSPSLALSSRAGLSYEGSSRDAYVPSNILAGNVSAQSIAYKRQLINVVTELTHNHALSEKMTLNMVLGNEIRNTDYSLTSVDGFKSMQSGGSDYVKVVTGYNANQTNALSDRDLQRLLSFYGIWKLNWDKKLDVDVTLRADGSSLYADKWALYPSVGLQYNLEEVVNYPVRMKAGWGRTGILNGFETYRGELSGFGEYYSRNKLGVGQLYPAFDQAKSIAVDQYDASVIADITSTSRLSIGYFNKDYSDFSYRRYLSNLEGVDYRFEKGAGLRMSGVDVDLHAGWLQNERFSWATDFSFAAYNNQISKLPDDIGNTSLQVLSGMKKGDAITSIRAYEGNQQRVIGDSRPSLFGGLGNTLRWNDFTASFLFTYSVGADVALASYTSRHKVSDVDGFPTTAGETPYYFREDQEGEQYYQGVASIQQASYVQLSRAMLSYRLRPLLDRWSTVKDMELFARGENLLTFSNYKGVNPEENINGIRRADLQQTGTPLPSSLVFGVKVKF